ncbi:MAG: TatD family hydrolase [Verrucomicrobia bacterium]|nr:TatD family hydrolase [Verrucomicrobiota bacterium]
MPLPLYDAHNHLQDERFAGRQADLVTTCRSVGVVRMVVNGACEADWPQVAALARQYPDLVIPSFGCHPWYVQERSVRWFETLERLLATMPHAAIGEAGLDRWKVDLSYEGQEEVLLQHLRLAAARNRPISLHCLRAWGRLYDLLRAEPRPARGFLLHSYGGPAEMVPSLAALGAYFSFPGYYLHERKQRQRETFRCVPPDRLLVETDAPDQPLPDEVCRHPLRGPDGRALNHPANLEAVYAGLADWLGESPASLAARVGANFRRLFENG